MATRPWAGAFGPAVWRGLRPDPHAPSLALGLLRVIVTGKFDHDVAADFVGILVPAVGQDHDAEFPAWHHPDIGGGIVEAAVLFNDRRLIAVADLPGERLRVAGADREDALLREVHGLA